MGHLGGYLGAIGYHSIITQALNGYHTQTKQFLNSSKQVGITRIFDVRNRTPITKLFHSFIRSF